MQVGIDPKIDYAFKRLFGVERNAELLLDLLNAVLDPPPGEAIATVQLLNPFNAKESWDDKLSIVDIKAVDQRGRLFHIEMQMLAHKSFPERLLYYWSRLFQEQLSDGENYAALRPTISICFLNDNLFPEVSDWRLQFGLWDAGHRVRLTDSLAIHLFELPKFDRPVDGLNSELERWLYFLRHGAQLDPMQLPNTLQVPPISHALEELTMLTHNDLERERYEARRKLILDENSIRFDYAQLQEEHAQMREQFEQLKEQIERGQTQLEQAEQRGLKQGLIKQIQSAQRVLQLPLALKEQLENRALEELQQLADELERQLLSR